jgi:DNA-binding beta-propeller fold protein YncE
MKPGLPTLALLLLAPCAALAAGPTPAAARLVWPPPPADPRIAYVQSIGGPADVGIKPAALTRVARWIAGGSAQGENLAKPFGVALDAADNLLLTDTGANAVCCFDRARKKWLRWEGVGKTRFQSPVAIARQGDTFFVADSALGKVLAFDAKGKARFEITNALERPSGLAIQGGKLFIADAPRHQIVVCDLKGKLLTQFGRRGSGPGEFNFPTHLAADPAGHLLVTDSMNQRVQVLDGTGRFVRSVGSAGDGLGRFSRPKGAAVDTAGRLYVVDALFDNVQIFDERGQLLLPWGEAGSEPGQFWLPNAIAIGRDNRIYVADSYNHRVQVFQYIGHE